MKRRFFILICTVLFASSGIMAASKPCKQCWTKLKSKGIKTLKVKMVAKNNIIKVQMKGIQKALEQAGINEKVTILLQIGDKRLGSLGSYAPSVKDDGQHDDGSVKDDGRHGDGKIKFISMPAVRNLRISQKMFDVFRSHGAARPKSPGTKAWKVRPARPKSPGTKAWKVRPARPARVTVLPGRTARPARPARVARPKSPTPPFGLLTFKNSMGQVMVYLQVQIRQY